MSEKKPPRGSLRPSGKRESIPASRRRSTVKLPPAQKTPLDVKPQREFALLTERMAELQKRLARKEEEHQGDADLIGKLLAEVADRDRKLKEARAASVDAQRIDRVEGELARIETAYAEAIADLETAQDRLAAAHEETRRLRAELETERTGRIEVERALEATHASLRQAHAELEARGAPRKSFRPKPPKNDEAEARARTDLAWLLEVLSTVTDQTRSAASVAQKHLEDARLAFERMRRQDDGRERGAAEAHAAIVATLRHATAVADGLDALELANERALRVTSTSERGGDDRAIDEARAIASKLWNLRDALALLVPRDEEIEGEQPPPAPSPPRRMRSRMPPAR